MLNRISDSLASFFSEEVDIPQQPQIQPAVPHPLLGAAINGDLVTISRIITLSPNLEVKDTAGNTPLVLAAAANQLAAVRVLLNNGAEIEARGNNGYTALHAAAYMGQESVVAFLAEQGADLNARSDNGAVPLSSAIHHGHAGVVLALIAAGANVNITDGNQFSILMCAVERGHADIVEYLLQGGANPNLSDHRGRTAMTIASACGRNDLLELLQRPEFARAFVVEHAEPQFEELVEMAAEENLPDTPNMLATQVEMDDAVDDDDPRLNDYLCPISQGLINDPITAPSGVTYDRESLRDWFAAKGNPEEVACPMTRLPIPIGVLSFRTNITMKNQIDETVSAIKAERQSARRSPAPLSPQDELRARRVDYFAGQALFSQSNQVAQDKTKEPLAVPRPNRIW